MSRRKKAAYVVRPEDIPPPAVLPMYGIEEEFLPERLKGKL